MYQQSPKLLSECAKFDLIITNCKSLENRKSSTFLKHDKVCAIAHLDN